MGLNTDRSMVMLSAPNVRPSLVVTATRMLRILLAIAMPLIAAQTSAATPADVLVIYANSRLLPANVELDQGLTQPATTPEKPAIEFFSEFLGAPVFEGEVYEAKAAVFLRDKYAVRPPRLIVVAGVEALTFLLHRREHMFPGVPVVHVGVERPYLESIALPPDVVGHPADHDIPGTLRLAISLHPHARKLVVVTGDSAWDRDQLAQVRLALSQMRMPAEVEYLSALPSAEVSARLSEIGSDAIVFTTGYFRDGAGATFTPRQTVEMMARASVAPIYAVYATQLGTGVVGGRMSSYLDMGQATRALVERIIVDGTVPAAGSLGDLPVPVQLDWRQVRRWGISEALVPPDALIHFREPTLWESYRHQVLVAVAVMLVQAALIAALLLERRRRRRVAAKLAASESRVGMAARAARLSTFEWHFPNPLSSNGRRDEPDPVDRADAPNGDFERLRRSVHPADRERFETAARRAAQCGAELDIEVRVGYADADVRWIAIRGQSPTGEPHRLTGVRLDVTPRKLAEMQAQADRAALTHLSRVATMGQLSAAIAHQLNQPLAAILGNAEIARKLVGREPLGRGELEEILDDIIAEDQRAAEIIRKLGALYRRGEMERSPLEVNDLARETLDLLRAELTLRHVSVALELDASRPRIEGSRIQLQQVLLNLVLNGADAMANNPPDDRQLLIRTERENEVVHLHVVDQGIGIAPDELKRMFDPFWSTKSSGLGVGLAICRTIVSAHQGTLSAQNNRSRGVRLSITLPALSAG